MTRQNLLLVPGLLCNAALWEHQSRYLDDIAEISIADTLSDDSVGDMAERILDAAPQRFCLAGLSMGGYVAQEIMRQAPDRVEKLALLDTSARPDSDEQRRRRRGLISLARTGKFKGVTPRLLPLLIHGDRLEDDALTRTIMEMAADVGQEAFLRQQTAILDRPDSRASLAAIHVPTLVVCGRQDELTPLDLSEEIAQGIEGARLCVIEECGHLSTMERPFAVTALMRDWLLNTR